MDPKQVQELGVGIRFRGVELRQMTVVAYSDFTNAAKRAIAMSRFFDCSIELIWPCLGDKEIRFQITTSTTFKKIRSEFNKIDFNNI